MFENGDIKDVSARASGPLHERHPGRVVSEAVAPVSASPGILGVTALLAGAGLCVAGVTAVVNAVD
ncbi:MULTISPECIES: hypothetical protein [unclassified Streptomyces]|uniref:hypothetical protein n=1 Tax=unclassified Streptomyces TaxID=2593676 RepID=UPI00190879D0|nr:hypothetical protein [Streptomyces sp. HSG2]